MYFDNYKSHTDTSVNPVLLWDYDLNNFDFQAMRPVVVLRVVERGWPNDWYALLNLYGESNVKETIKNIPYLNDRDMHFVSVIFQIPLNDLKCYEQKQLHHKHWNS